jgi:ABC-2 type transport system ATP-binding protein
MAIMNQPALKIESLCFRYPGQGSMLFSDLSLEIATGERFGLFGPNGAGKTTLISLMTGLLGFESGNIWLYGNTIKSKDKEVNKLFGFVPQNFSFYQELSPVENLEFFGAWSGLNNKEIKKRIDELMEIMNLQSVQNKPVSQFSEGMKRRVNLAIGIIHSPRILFLDEPTVGVDVQTRHGIIDYLKELNENGTTLIYTSHQLSEAEGLCKKIAFINEGKIIACGDMETLLADNKEKGLEGLFLNLTGKDFRNQ